MPISWHGLQSDKSLLQWYIQSKAHWNASTLRESEAIYSAIIRGFCNVGKVPGGSLDGEQQHGHMGPNALIFFLGRVDSSQLPMSLMPKASWGLPVTSWGLTKNLTTNNLVSRLKKSICRDLIKPYVCSCFFFQRYLQCFVVEVEEAFIYLELMLEHKLQPDAMLVDALTLGLQIQLT